MYNANVGDICMYTYTTPTYHIHKCVKGLKLMTDMF